MASFGCPKPTITMSSAKLANTNLVTDSRRTDLESAIQPQQTTFNVVKTTTVIVSCLLLSAFSAFSIYWGYHYSKFDCEHILATWSMVLGGFGLAISLYSTGLFFYSNCKGDRVNIAICSYSSLLLITLVIFQVCWICAGVALSWQMFRYGHDICPQPLYYFVICSSTILLAIMVLILIIISCITGTFFDLLKCVGSMLSNVSFSD